MSKPIVSICIPTYNRAMLLQECLSQTLAFQGAGIEVIVSDNASADDTVKIVSSFKDPRLKYFRNEENIGFVRNFFRVLSHAKGEWVLFLSDEDYAVNLGELLDTLSSIEDGVVVAMGGISKESGGHYRKSKFKMFSKGDAAAVAIGFIDLYLSGIALRRNIALKYFDHQWDISDKGLFPHLTIILSAVVNNGNLVTLGFDICVMGGKKGGNLMDSPGGKSSKSFAVRLLHFEIYSTLAINSIVDIDLQATTVAEVWAYQAKRAISWGVKGGVYPATIADEFYEQSMHHLAKIVSDEVDVIGKKINKEINKRRGSLLIGMRMPYWKRKVRVGLSLVKKQMLRFYYKLRLFGAGDT